MNQNMSRNQFAFMRNLIAGNLDEEDIQRRVDQRTLGSCIYKGWAKFNHNPNIGPPIIATGDGVDAYNEYIARDAPMRREAADLSNFVQRLYKLRRFNAKKIVKFKRPVATGTGSRRVAISA